MFSSSFWDSDYRLPSNDPRDSNHTLSRSVSRYSDHTFSSYFLKTLIIHCPAVIVATTSSDAPRISNLMLSSILYAVIKFIFFNSASWASDHTVSNIQKSGRYKVYWCLLRQWWHSVQLCLRQCSNLTFLHHLTHSWTNPIERNYLANIQMFGNVWC